MTNILDFVIGIDIGGTNTVLGAVNRDGELLVEQSLPTWAHEEPEKLVARIYENIEGLRRELTVARQLRGIGIGAPNGNYYRGTVENPPNLSWKGVIDIVGLFRKYYQVPIAVTNDANAAALGELLFGLAKGMKDFIVITLGTGVGSGIVANGQLVYGVDGFAGEIGHTIYDPEGRQCGCGRKGCLETYASAGGICRTVFELLSERKEPSELHRYSFEELTAEVIAEAAKRGDPIALEAFEFTGKVLGFKLADSVAHTSPEAIILHGGLANAGNLIFAPTKKHLEENLLPIFRNRIKLLPSGVTGGSPAVLGASALIWKEMEQHA
jgi:glucokinase